MLTDTRNSKNKLVYPLEWDSVKWTGGLWNEVTHSIETNTISHIEKMFKDTNISHVIDNFLICSNQIDGDFGGTDFGDGDFYKWLEAAIYLAYKTNNIELQVKIEEYVEMIAKCQQDDGYISTKQIISERLTGRNERFDDINNFEVYNFGHLFTTACIHHRITGKDTMLNIAKRAADYLETMYNKCIETGEVKTAVCPSHYMGLVELYRTTKEIKYLNLAKLTIELRDHVSDGSYDNQDKLPLKSHDKIMGHAVRANYLYAGVADLCIEEKDDEYLEMLERVWTNLVNSKLYITGGCGALYNGVAPYGNYFDDAKVHQAYGYEYQLPNVTAYNETCASIGLVLWAYRMFQLNPKAEYFNIIERAMLNVNLAAINLKGDKFFYENMLRRVNSLDYELVWPLTRKGYIESFCCPPNLTRLLSESSEYAYLQSDDGLWIGLYGESSADIKLKNGTEFHVEQSTNYPYEGEVKLKLSDIKGKEDFKINIRIPDWLSSGEIQYGDHRFAITADIANSYLPVIVPANTKTYEINVMFEMPVRNTIAHSKVEEACNQVAIEKGPLVYCFEANDYEGDTIDECLIDPECNWQDKWIEIDGRKILAIEGINYQNEYCTSEQLYTNLGKQEVKLSKLKLIPYYAWDNRGFGEMRVWLPLAHKISKRSKL